MSYEHESDVPATAWVFGLEEIPAWDADEHGTIVPIGSAFSRTVIRVPADVPPELGLAADEIVSHCGPDWSAPALLLDWLRLEAGDKTVTGVEGCHLEWAGDGTVRFHAVYRQWADFVVPVEVARRLLIELVAFVVDESRRPLPGWRIRRLGGAGG